MTEKEKSATFEGASTRRGNSVMVWTRLHISISRIVSHLSCYYVNEVVSVLCACVCVSSRRRRRRRRRHRRRRRPFSNFWSHCLFFSFLYLKKNLLSWSRYAYLLCLCLYPKFAEHGCWT